MGANWKRTDGRIESSALHPAGDSGLEALDEWMMDDIVGAATNAVGTMGCCNCVPWYSGWTVCGWACDMPQCDG